jgi:hypothetical protein
MARGAESADRMIGSPPGSSTLMTSASILPRIYVATGANTAVVRSTTRMPGSGPDMAAISPSIPALGHRFTLARRGSCASTQSQHQKSP